jgi:hypothetical protein
MEIQDWMVFFYQNGLGANGQELTLQRSGQKP